MCGVDVILILIPQTVRGLAVAKDDFLNEVNLLKQCLGHMYLFIPFCQVVTNMLFWYTHLSGTFPTIVLS